MIVTLDFGGGAAARFDSSSAVDIGTFHGEHVHQRCLLGLDPAFPLWRVYFRPDIDGQRDEAVVEYGRIDGLAPVSGPYTATISRDGSTLQTYAVPKHFQYQRWRWQSAPRPVVRTPADLKRRHWVANFGPDGMFGTLPSTYAAKWNGPIGAGPPNMNNVMGTAGDNPMIGLLTEAGAQYQIFEDVAALQTLRVEGEWYANAPMYMRNADGSMLDPRGAYYGTKVVAPPAGYRDPSYIDIEHDHWYPAPNAGWALTDDPYLLESLQFGIIWRLLYSSYDRQQYKLDGLFAGTTRGRAWALRDTFLAAASTPENVPKWLQPPSVWRSVLADNLAYASKMLAGPTKIAQLFGIWNRPDLVASWMQAWLTSVIGLGVQQGFTEWRPVFEAGLKMHVAQTNGTSGWSRQFPAPYYWHPVKSLNPSWAKWAKGEADPALDAVTCSSWGEAWDYFARGSDGRTGVLDTSSWDGTKLISTNGSYYLDVRAALALALDLGYTEARPGYDYLQSQYAAQAPAMQWRGQTRRSVDPQQPGGTMPQITIYNHDPANVQLTVIDGPPPDNSALQAELDAANAKIANAKAAAQADKAADAANVAGQGVLDALG